jgi:hypothetical protein
VEEGCKGIERAHIRRRDLNFARQETFFDGKVFDPENPSLYLKSLSIKRIDA